MPKTLIYLTDDIIYITNLKNKQINKVNIPKNIIINGKVANINKFINKFNSIIKEYNLNNGFFGDNIKILIHAKYNPADITLLKNIFEKMNFRKINIEQENIYYKLNEKNAWLNINNNYSILTYINDYKKCETYLIENTFFDNLEDFYKYLKSKIKTKELYLIGSGNLLENIYKDFEVKYQNRTYMFDRSEFYLMDCITNL